MIEVFVSGGVLSLFLFWLYYNVVRPYYRRHRNLSWLNGHKMKRAQALFQTLYNDVDAFMVSKQARVIQGIKDDSLTYGEIQFLDFAAILQLVNPEPHEVFYDLGSGSAKALVAMAMLYDLKKIVGIECLPELCKLAKEQLKKPELHDIQIPIHVIQADFLAYDFSEANIVLINIAGLREDKWDTLVEKLKMLKAGSRIIVISKSLPKEEFQLIDARMRGMSWGLNSVYLYVR